MPDHVAKGNITLNARSGLGINQESERGEVRSRTYHVKTPLVLFNYLGGAVLRFFYLH